MVWTTLTSVDGVSRQHNGSAVIVRPSGDLDLGGAPAFRSMLLRAISGGANAIEVDLVAVDFVDSAGIGVLVGALRRLRQRGGSLRLVNVPLGLANIFDVTGLDRVFEIVDP